MNPISKFFDKFKNIIKNDVVLKQALSDAIERHAKIRISSSDIAIKDGCARIPASSVARNEIYIKKSAILSDLKGGGFNSLRDLR